MGDAREAILARIRRTTQHTKESDTAVQQRLTSRAHGTLPAFAEEKLTRFITQAKKAATDVTLIPQLSELAKAVDDYLTAHNLPRRLVIAPSPLLNEVKWPAGFTIERRAAGANDQAAVSIAYAGIAETGTLALLSGKDTPTTLNFLPDTFICLLRRDDLLMHMEEVWQRLRLTAEGMPRSMNFVTGPSRTADVEQTIQLGAHGPRRLLIVIQAQ
jgi:L-lactate dehydrogenase complex protein LldG